MLTMPGRSYRGSLPPLTRVEKVLSDTLKLDLEKLAIEIGERNRYNYLKLMAAANFIAGEMSKCGYETKRLKYKISNQTFENLEVEIKGNSQPDEIVIIGAHYDTVYGCPGANDNGSGVAGLLALARAFAGKQTRRTLRFVFFANEEPPFFMTEYMGSVVYAKRCHQREEKIVAMLSLESIGYYSDELGSQKFPPGLNEFYPSTGNYIAFVSNLNNSNLVCDVIESFRRHTQFPSEGTALPPFGTGVNLSDHWSFWQQGYPALMVTDTAFFRYPYYHRHQDTPDKVDCDRTARVIAGLERVIGELSGVKIEELIAS